MERQLAYLQEKYAPVGLLVYGSWAEGTNGPSSDLDVLVLTENGVAGHDESVVDGVTLDAFIYPASELAGGVAPEDFCQVEGGRILLDKTGLLAELKAAVEAWAAAFTPEPLSARRSALAWCRKMQARALRGDPEGLYRWHWLLTESLQIYFETVGQRWRGPKKALRLLRETDRDAAEAYERALSGLDGAALDAWLTLLESRLPNEA